MAEQDSGQERTEDPTEKRLADARKKGQVPRSKDLEATVIMMFGASALLIFGPYILDRLRSMFITSLQMEPRDYRVSVDLLTQTAEVLVQALWLILPFGFVSILIALLTPMAMGGFIFSTKTFIPNFGKLNPIKGFARLFSLKGLVELLKALGKVSLVGGVCLLLFAYLKNDIFRLQYLPEEQGIMVAAEYLGWSLLLMSCVLIVIAAADVPFQLYQHHKQLKMTRQEIRDEMKDTEGKPEVKARIRRMQNEMAHARMMSAVPDADVIVTNPTHYAVALKYDQSSMAAPRVVAKGRDQIAETIREIAREHRIPLVSAPPLARAIFASTKLEQEIPQALYIAVAEVLAFVLQLKASRRQGMAAPKAPNPSVPEDFKQRYKVDDM